VNRNLVEDLAEHHALEVLEERLRRLDHPHAPARLLHPPVAVMAETFVARGVLQLVRVAEPPEVGCGKPEHAAQVSQVVENCDRPGRLPHDRVGEEPPRHTRRRL
jgi:hypothetical protein